MELGEPQCHSDGGEVSRTPGGREDEGRPWRPQDEADPSPEGIMGRVTFVGEVRSDGGSDSIPLINIESADGTVWVISGDSMVLRNQISKADPSIGDIMGFRYFSKKSGETASPR